MKHRILLWTLMILYLGFMIGWFLKPDCSNKEYFGYPYYGSKSIVNNQQVSNGSWVEAWEKSQDLEIRACLIIEGLWCTNEDKLVEMIFKDGDKEEVVGYAIYVYPKPGSIWVMDIAFKITTWDKPSKYAILYVRSSKHDEKSTDDCGFTKYYFKYKPRPKTDKELNEEPVK